MRERRVCTKRNVPSPEAPRRSPERGNTRRSIAEDRAAACELPPSRRASEYAGTSVVCLSARRSKSAWSANLTLWTRARARTEGKDESEDQDKRKRQVTNGTRLDVIQFDWFARTAASAATTPLSYFLWRTVNRYTANGDTNKELSHSFTNSSEDSRVVIDGKSNKFQMHNTETTFSERENLYSWKNLSSILF